MHTDTLFDANGERLSEGSTLERFRCWAQNARNDSFLPDNLDAVEQALLIREVESAFLDLFSRGLMNGTVHTCIGQEFSAVSVAANLTAEDWITSNHRCHGHFIAKTGLWQGLIDELMGLASGVCKGIGSSQHLFAEGFLSNGPQGALLPVGSGIAAHFKLKRMPNIVASFIGEGTLGEGVVYEALNLAALRSLPQLFVCENNGYSQSTPQTAGVAGSITDRAAAFGIKVFEANTWQLADLFETASAAASYVRDEGKPAFLLMGTYRLKAHSKGDDDRDPEEIAFFEEKDSLARLVADHPSLEKTRTALRNTIATHIESVEKTRISVEEYRPDQLPRKSGAKSTAVSNERIRMVQAINQGLEKALAAGGMLLGEDICDPYGGAFKVTKGLSTRFPEQVIGSPISEAGIAGMGAGLALMGHESYVEIMFGDFMTNIFDQLINNVSKFHHMYAFQASVPVRIRTPMGGKRGYGPTHSQSLEKHLVGIDNLLVLAATSLEDPRQMTEELSGYPGPAIVLENKTDYGRMLWQDKPELTLKKLGGDYGSLVLAPTTRQPNVTLVCYGGTARELADKVEDLFVETDCVAELIVLTKLHPLDITPITRSVSRTGTLIVVEDGSCPFGIGAEVLAQVAEAGVAANVYRIGAEPVPIPSIGELEHEMLPTYERVAQRLRKFKEGLRATPGIRRS